MANPTDKQQRNAKVAAGLTVVFVGLFALAYVGVITMLNVYADNELMARQEEEVEVDVGAEAPTDPFYVLLIGSDSRKGTALYTGKSSDGSQTAAYADILTLMRVDPQRRLVTLVTIPRDTVVDGSADKINASLLSDDPGQVVDAVGQLTGTYADYYMMTTFISFENLVNALGGITVDVPKTITVSDPASGKDVKVKAGKKQLLNGSQALALARARKEYEGGADSLRQVNVRRIERALIKKVLAMDGDFDAEHVLAALEDDTKTNVDLPSMGLLMIDFVQHADEVRIFDCTGPYEGENRQSDGAWVVPGDEETWERLMAVVDAGENPSSVVKAPTF